MTKLHRKLLNRLEVGDYAASTVYPVSESPRTIEPVHDMLVSCSVGYKQGSISFREAVACYSVSPSLEARQPQS